jgi:hypothetical protein
MQVSSATILQLGRAKKYLCLVSCVIVCTDVPAVAALHGEPAHGGTEHQ